MNAKQISAMIERVTGRKVSVRAIRSYVRDADIHGATNDRRQNEMFNSGQIESILTHFGVDPESCVGKG